MLVLFQGYLIACYVWFIVVGHGCAALSVSRPCRGLPLDLHVYLHVHVHVVCASVRTG